MTLSPFFTNLRSAYEAELDDLAFDTDGHHVLHQRLADKQQGLDFLLQVMDVHPEMVAVLFHGAFNFQTTQHLQRVVALETDQVPAWDSLEGVALLPHAQVLAKRVLQEPAGPWLLTVAAALEYLQSQSPATDPLAASAENDGDEEEDENDNENDDGDDQADQADLLDSDEEGSPDYQTAKERDEAGADWLASQGFDRKK